jgi:DNA-binding NtrC family response regulator
MLSEKARFHDLVGRSPGMVRVYEQIRDLAPVDATVLIEGETGTGKELAARAMHYASRRADKTYVTVNCAGLSETLLGSQLFGHKRGAFTGAVEDQKGIFETADGGTVFLDEIGDISASVQTMLLRVLQEKEITRLGEVKPRKVDVRILAATHRNLAAEVAAGRFRQDLLYRVRVARIQLPPLRDRREDIPLLAEAFLARSRASTGKDVRAVSADTMQKLLAHAWPGNVRELQSAIEIAVIHCKGSAIQPGDLPAEIGPARYGQPMNLAHRSFESPLGLSDSTARASAANTGSVVEADERSRILQALRDAGGNRVAAARLLGCSRATLYRRLADLSIEQGDPGAPAH